MVAHFFPFFFDFFFVFPTTTLSETFVLPALSTAIGTCLRCFLVDLVLCCEDKQASGLYGRLSSMPVRRCSAKIVRRRVVHLVLLYCCTVVVLVGGFRGRAGSLGVTISRRQDAMMCCRGLRNVLDPLALKRCAVLDTRTHYILFVCRTTITTG